MVSLYPRRLRDKLWPEPLPPARSFEGQTVLITGATGGLGLAAATHFVSFGANVIITSRNERKGSTAVGTIEQMSGTCGREKVEALELDMNTYSSCVSFVERLKNSRFGRNGFDVVVLNAGLINVDYSLSPEGWEQTIQVHTLSTVLLGLLLLDWMKTKAPLRSDPSHLIFVSSRKHLLPDITSWQEMSRHSGILRHHSDEQNWASGQIDPNYSETKLMLTYAVEEMCRLALGPDGLPDVVINTVCPGLVATELGRRAAKASLLSRLYLPLYFAVLGKSPSNGARIYLIAARTRRSDHGRYVQSIYTDAEYRRLAMPNVTSERAHAVRKLVWKEIIRELWMKTRDLSIWKTLLLSETVDG